jgi:putative ABC transport system permease protein
MLQHNLKIAWRVLRRNIGYTTINFLGISAGIAVCLLIGLYIQHELSYDKYHKNYKSIYRLANKVDGASFENGMAKISAPWGPAAAENIPEVQSMCRFISYGETLFEKGKEKFYESRGFYADSTVFEIFGWKLLKGDDEKCLLAPNTIVLTRTMAEKYFGTKDPVGEILTIDNTNQYAITGVMEDVPSNSHFLFDFLASMNSYSHPDMQSWVKWPQFYTYLLLKPSASPLIVADKADRLLAEHLDSAQSVASTPLLQPIASIHLHSNLFREIEANSDISYIYIFSSLALFIIIIACLNFINLSTAQAGKRANEVGIRKVAGASRKSLVGQYFGEASLIGIAAMLFAVLLASLSLPYLNTFLEKQLTFDWFNNIPLTAGLLLLTTLVILLSGLYPAIVLSSFRPVKILGAQLITSKGFGLRKALVVCQFTISIIMIIASIISTRQLKYIQNKNLGFNKDQVLIIPFRDPSTVNHIETIKEQLKNLPGVESVSASGNRPGGSDWGIPVSVVGISPDNQPSLRCLLVDHDFLDTYQMQIASGRGFKNKFATDTAAYLLNEEAVTQLNLKNPVGQLMEMPAIHREAAPIVGVVKDFHFRSLHEKIAPLFFFIEQSWFTQLSIRIKTKDMDKTIGLIKDNWTSFEPKYPFTYSFFDETFSNLYRAETRTALLVRVFAFLAIFIACLGLFGLSAYIATQRTKEIGIRKVLGASVAGITAMLSKDFIKLVVIAAFIAWPLAWWGMNKWLQDFAYRTNIGWWVFALAGVSAIVIALLTVSFQAIKAASANPVKSLRTE